MKRSPMKVKYTALILLLMCILSGCIKNEFVIEATLADSINRTYTIIYYTSDKKKGWITESVLSVTGGKGKVQCITRNPTLVWLRAGSGASEIAIWAERGDKIDITGKEADPLTWDVGGNDVNEEWSKWRQQNIIALRSRDSKKINPAVAKYVNANADTPLAVLLMLTTYVRKDDEAGFDKLWNKIPADVKSNEILAAVGRADLLTAAPIDPPVKVGPFKLHCEGDTILTVTPAKSDVSLVYFWTGDEQERKTDIDSIKKLYREDRGSKLLDITDIALTQDSMSWLNKIRLDSLGDNKWRRGWAPGGRLNANISAFAVPASPWFVVIDAKGNQIYTGSKVADALKTVRNQLKRVPERKTPSVKTDTATKTDTVK